MLWGDTTRALASVINKTPRRLSRRPEEEDERECSGEAAHLPTTLLAHP